MPIPDFQALMLPLLDRLSAGESGSQNTLDALALRFKLTPEEVAEPLPSGGKSKFSNRIAWAKAHLKAAGLLESPKRGVYRLSDRGRQVLQAKPPSVSISFLTQYPEYVAFRFGNGASGSSSGTAQIPLQDADSRTPNDLIDEGYTQLKAALLVDLRERMAAMTPSAFEQLVIDVLTKMGYGGAQENAGIVVGKSGDEGIDGIIKEDRLGLETIYVQAKRWQGTVGRPEIQRFAGALQGQRARKGVFITSSAFSSEARGYAQSIQTTIVLVDGAQLADLMFAHGVGVATVRTLEIKRVDSDYFDAEA